MKLQITKLVLVFSISILGFSACNKDDCTAPTISENIIGVWEVDNSGDEVEFKGDGTFVDEEGAILGEDAMSGSYSITGEDEMDITVTDNAGWVITLGFSILKNECDEIKISGGFGTSATLNRK